MQTGVDKCDNRSSAASNWSAFRRVLLTAAAVFAIALALAIAGFVYVAHEIGEHEHRRVLRYVGIDPDLKIADSSVHVLPAATLKYEILKHELLDLAGAEHVVAVERDSLETSGHFAPLRCFRGQFDLLVESEADFDEIVRRVANFAYARGLLHHVADDEDLPHPDPLVKESHTFPSPRGMRGKAYRTLRLRWANPERESSIAEPLEARSPYRLGFDYSALGCFRA